jgi:hypothetical protein
MIEQSLLVKAKQMTMKPITDYFVEKDKQQLSDI